MRSGWGTRTAGDDKLAKCPLINWERGCYLDLTTSTCLTDVSSAKHWYTVDLLNSSHLFRLSHHPDPSTWQLHFSRSPCQKPHCGSRRPSPTLFLSLEYILLDLLHFEMHPESCHLSYPHILDCPVRSHHDLMDTLGQPTRVVPVLRPAPIIGSSLPTAVSCRLPFPS